MRTLTVAELRAELDEIPDYRPTDVVAVTEHLGEDGIEVQLRHSTEPGEL